MSGYQAQSLPGMQKLVEQSVLDAATGYFKADPKDITVAGHVVFHYNGRTEILQWKHEAAEPVVIPSSYPSPSSFNNTCSEGDDVLDLSTDRKVPSPPVVTETMPEIMQTPSTSSSSSPQSLAVNTKLANHHNQLGMTWTTAEDHDERSVSFTRMNT